MHAVRIYKKNTYSLFFVLSCLLTLISILELKYLCQWPNRNDDHNLPNHSVSALTDIRQVCVAGAHVKHLASHGLAPGLDSGCGRSINRARRPSGRSSIAVVAWGCRAARIRHSSSPPCAATSCLMPRNRRGSRCSSAWVQGFKRKSIVERVA